MVPAARSERAPATGALVARLDQVLARIADAAARSGRDPSAVTLVAVSKSVDAQAVRGAQAAGQCDFGESRAQELVAKSAEVPGARWHVIGRLQRNKARDVVGRAVLVHSVDRWELAQALAARAQSLGVEQEVLVQVNASRDPLKAGVAPADALALVERVAALDGLRCTGLMSVPAAEVDPRPAFARLRTLRDAARARDPRVVHLSMGMSGDFEAAVEEGATLVRVGSALFGARPDAGRGARVPVA